MLSSPSCSYAECAYAPQSQTHRSRAKDLLYFVFILDVSMSPNYHYFTLVEGPHAALHTNSLDPIVILVRYQQT